MSVIFNQEAEDRRNALLREKRARKAKTWELLKTYSEAEAVKFARDNGWKDKKVQVRALRVNATESEFYVEPFEKDCNCPSILRYSDYFD